MNPEDINLESIDKLFEYEKHCRVLDTLDGEELVNFAKLYCKLYLKQQEVVTSLAMKI
jgi:hypothetical protein